MQATAPVPKRSPLRELTRRILNVPELSVIVALVVLLVVFTLENEKMLSPENLSVILRTMSFTGIVVVGEAFLIIAGEIDLSVGGVYALASAMAGFLMVTLGWPVLPAVGAVLLCGISVGLFNGLVTVKLGLPAFIVTLGTAFAARSIGDVVTNGNFIWGMPASFVDFGKSAPLGITLSLWLLIILVIGGDFALRRTIFGAYVTATGGNKQAARVAGIPADWVKISCFILTSILATLAGLLATALFATGDSHLAPGMELDAIASCVIGGISLFGGVGSIIGAFLGTGTLQVIRSGLIMAGINIDWQNVAVGSILALAASVDLLRRRAKKY
jgi:ribose transport system permease protein